MKFQIARSTFFNALSKVSKSVSSKSPMPVLNGIKFECFSDYLVLTGSDSNLTIQATISENITIEKPGSIILPQRLILEIIRKVEADYISVEIIDGLLTQIKANKSEFNLNGMRVEDFPLIDLSKEGHLINLSIHDLKTIVNEISFAASIDNARIELTGISFDFKGNSLECIATDSFRLAKKAISIDNDNAIKIIIPTNSLREISRIYSDDQPVNIYVSNKRILFETDSLIIQSRLIDGNYPDVSRLIPTQFDYEVTLNKHDIFSAIERASLFTQSISNHTITLSLSSNNVNLQSKSQEIGSLSEDISCDYHGGSLEVSFSSRYVLEAIKAIDSEAITFSFGSSMTPFILKGFNQPDLVQLVLPVRTY